MRPKSRRRKKRNRRPALPKRNRKVEWIFAIIVLILLLAGLLWNFLMFKLEQGPCNCHHEATYVYPENSKSEKITITCNQI